MSGILFFIFASFHPLKHSFSLFEISSKNSIEQVKTKRKKQKKKKKKNRKNKTKTKMEHKLFYKR